MKYTTLAATELTPQSTVISISPENKNWYTLDEGFEFLVHINLKIQGAEVADSDDEEDATFKLLEQDKVEDICTISAILILSESISEEYYDPYVLCDNYSGDLEFVYSVIKEYNLEFDEDKMKMRNIVYIDKISWNPELDTETKKQVIDQLKGFIIHLNKHLNFSEDEINEHLGRRNKKESYPREYINQDEFIEFEKLGFKEIGETRLLLKFLD